MPLSWAQKKAAMSHILKTVFDQDNGSFLHKSLSENSITSPHDLCALDVADIEMFEYTDDEGNLKPLPYGNISLLKAFKAYVQHRAKGPQPITDATWTTITADPFDSFRITPEYTLLSATSLTTTNILVPSICSNDPVHDFCKGIKQDIASSIAFKDDAAWEHDFQPLGPTTHSSNHHIYSKTCPLMHWTMGSHMKALILPLTLQIVQFPLLLPPLLVSRKLGILPRLSSSNHAPIT